MIEGEPHGIAVTAGGVVYVGLARSQSVVAIDPKNEKILREVVLDSEEIASTKELLTMRLNHDESRLVVAQGSDESVTILALPSLHVVREIGLEGETIRDAVPDPQGRYLYVLGRSVRVFDAIGERELRTLADVEPMAIAANRDGSLLAVIGSEEFESGKATVAVFYETETFKETGRVPLETDRIIRSAFFAAGDRSLVALASDWLAEKSIRPRVEKSIGNDPSAMRMTLEFGDLASGEAICLPEGSGPQIGVLTDEGKRIVFAEARCSSGSETFTGSRREVQSSSLYGISAYALAIDPSSGSIFATDRAGFLTRYRMP